MMTRSGPTVVTMTIARAILAVLAAVLTVVLAAPAPAQQGATELERIRTEKKAWVALNMELAPAEAEAFWPVYEGYQKELNQINTRLARTIDAYATHYRNNTLTDEAARKLTEDSLAVDESEVKLRRTYLSRLAKVLPARKVARYLQLEARIHTQVRYELAANLPLAGDFKFGAPRATK
jgi:hypothetical protein